MNSYNPTRVGMGQGQGRGYKNILTTDCHIHYLSAKGIRIKQPFFPGIKMGHNPLELSLFIPSTTKNSEGKDMEVTSREFTGRLQDAERKLSNLFGGYTRVNAEGGWVNEKDRLVEEKVGSVTTYVTESALTEKRAELERYIEGIRKSYKQDSIGIGFEGDMFFYAPKKEEGR